VERREASAPWPGCALRPTVQQGDPGFSAFCLPFIFRPFFRWCAVADRDRSGFPRRIYLTKVWQRGFFDF
jgi:hypothetical protein